MSFGPAPTASLCVPAADTAAPGWLAAPAVLLSPPAIMCDVAAVLAVTGWKAPKPVCTILGWVGVQTMRSAPAPVGRLIALPAAPEVTPPTPVGPRLATAAMCAFSHARIAGNAPTRGWPSPGITAWAVPAVSTGMLTPTGLMPAAAAAVADTDALVSWSGLVFSSTLAVPEAAPERCLASCEPVSASFFLTTNLVRLPPGDLARLLGFLESDDASHGLSVWFALACFAPGILSPCCLGCCAGTGGAGGCGRSESGCSTLTT
mmetsp:Transcript_24306/g.43109  ORF Transcript_24306/g.43109 Transcript_24306/m.43109 type:complete len:262 (-) Transcript_24306:1727-2512(-)